MNYLIELCDRLGILRSELDYHFLRASMVLIFLFFGYQKWWEYEAQALVPYISNGPLIFWMYPVFGIRGATWFLGVSEWLFGALLCWGFWNKKAGVLGALGAIASFLSTTTIIPFFPDGWAASAGGSSNERERGIPDEGLRPACRVLLSAETGPGESVAPGKQCRRPERNARYHSHATNDRVTG
jgi:uncharacterized membrane protein YkgB